MASWLSFRTGRVRLLEPELLLYKPEKNGKVWFVGVEYLVPFTVAEGSLRS